MLERQSGASRQENEVFGRLESKVQSYARNFPRIFSRARGTELWDVHGGRYLDFLAGAGSLNFGHNNPVFKEALIDYIEQDAITHSLDLHTEAKESFLEAMHDILLAPRGLDYVMQFTGPTGTNAVEAALKIARKVTGRPNVIYFTNGFHGVSMGALSVTGNEYLRARRRRAVAGRDADAVRRLLRPGRRHHRAISSACSPTHRAAWTLRPRSSSKPFRARAASTWRATSGCSACRRSATSARSC